MSEQKKPCPNPACGNKYPELIGLDGMFFRVVCHRCGIAGKKIESEDDDTDETLAVKAIAAWNALPRALVWTPEPPKQENQYYWALAQNLMLMIIKTVEINGELFAILAGDERECPLSDFLEWAGPIPVPQEQPA